MGEKDFITELSSGNRDAFRRLVDEFKGLVFNAALNILQNRDDADDISQEVFIEIFRSIGRFQGESKLSTWIYRITMSKSLEFLRSKKRKKRFAIFRDLFSPDDNSIQHEIKHFEHPGVILENKELSEILFKAIDRLPGNQKAVFTLHKIEGLSYKEMSEVLEITVSSVESLMFRAKNNMKKYLSDYYEKHH